MNKVLVTGGAGFIGSSLVDKLLSTGNYSVVSIDNFLTGRKAFINQHPNYQFIECDINVLDEISAVMKNNHFDYIFHYAATVGVKRTLDNPKLVLEDIKGLQNIFELSKETKVKRIFFSSSSEVYGDSIDLPQHEFNTPLNSRLPYAVVKNLGECFCRSYKKEHALNYTILRFFNTYGLRQSDDFVITKFLTAALKNEDITVYGDGSQKRTFCYIDDNVDFTLKILENDLFKNDTVNVGNNSPISIGELASLIVEVTNSSSKIINVQALEEGDMARRLPDITKMLSVLNRPHLSLADGLRKIISDLKMQEDRTRTVIPCEAAI